MFLSAATARAQQTPYLGAPVSLPGTIQAENYDFGGQGVAWNDTTPGNAFGPVYRTHDMDVGAIPAGGYHIGALANGEWAEYTVNVAASGGYTMIVRYASATTLTTRFRVLVDGVDVSGPVSITSTGDWQAYTTKAVPVTLSAGNNRVLRVSFELGAFNFDSLQFTRLAVCNSPDQLRQNIHRALSGQPDLCDWVPDVNPNFPYSTPQGQSYNLPVLAAASAFIREPVRTTGTKQWNMYTWWTDYLRGELGDRGTPTWYYGGQELGSYVYQQFNIISVLAVHYQAHITGQTTIRDLARRWLRATFALHALAASQGPAQTLHAKGQSLSAGGYTGPYVGMAGMRSSWGYWRVPDRNILFARATGFGFSGNESPTQRDVREYVEARWTGPGGNVYGFTAADQTALRGIVTSAALPASFVATYLGNNLRTIERYHFVAWPGVKVTLLEKNRHGSTAPTFGVAYFTSPRAASGNEAHFLYPWQGLFDDASTAGRHGITQGEGRIDVTSTTNRFIWATNAPGSTTHPLETVQIDGLPLGPRSYWIVLSPTAAPALQ